ncbi:MIP family channel protein [Maioricimonas sp. JC845]|uniref:MIP/aquaporin family protein n=1 Tax=Maioricimonas sp. JC845 TaxID=3232138 RepID=UPI00345B4AA1
MLRKCIAEILGTFALVFTGTAAVVVNDLHGGNVTHVGISLTFGLIVMAMIYSIGDISGAHINPAVTIAFWIGRRFPLAHVLPYIIAQCAGALAASLLLASMFPDHGTLGATLPSGPVMQSFILEILLTFILMFVILNVSTGAKEKGIMAGAAIGAVVALEALCGGPVSGASMNPARSLGPAAVSHHLEHHWAYWVGPILGATLAVPISAFIRSGNGTDVPVAEDAS